VSGDAEHSPWPFRVNARTGELATQAVATYTANWTGALRLFDGLVQLRAANRAAYESARTTLIAWIKEYPLRTNKWGPFFEDITGWSDTEINADTMAWYILEHRGKDAFHDAPNHSIARCVLDWTLTTFGTNYWSKYGVTAIQEQTAYRVPGNSHTSRHASVELLYAEKSGDTLRKEDAIRQLNWATYMVDDDGKNRYPNDDIWLTDGYGDYLRHYLRAMAAAPELAPEAQDHLLRSSSTIQQIAYASASITYTTFDQPSRERLRISFAPREVRAGNRKLKRLKELQDLERNEGYYFEAAGPRKGLLEIGHSKTGAVVITK
jgi:ribosomal protein S19E (S16A)